MKTRFLLSTFSLLLVVASATTLRAQSVAGSNLSTTTSGVGYGKGGKPKPTPTPVDARRDWGNTGSDFNTNANWTAGTGGVSPGLGDVGYFLSAATFLTPNLSASKSIAGLLFSGTGSSGYDITSSGGATFTLTGVGATGASCTSNSTAAALRGENTSGTNTIDAPIILGAAAAATQVFFQASGGTLVVNSILTNTNAITLDLKGTGIIQLNGSNTSLTAAVRINDAGTTLVVGNDNALGTGSFTFASSGTIQAGGGARTIANNLLFATGTPTIGGTNDITFNGTATNSGAANRTVTVNNSGITTFAGSFFLAGDDATGRTVTINGTGAVTISGVVANNNAGGTVASNLIKSGSNTLTLTNTNTYTGTTTVNAGTLFVNGSLAAASAVTVNNSGSVLGGTGTISGSVSVASSGAVLLGGTGTTGASQKLTISGSLSMASGSIIELALGAPGAHSTLALTGASAGSFATTQHFSFIDVGAQPGTYQDIITGVTTNPFPTDTFVIDNPGWAGTFTWDGSNIDLNLTAVPEPSTYVAGALALFGVAWMLRKRFVRRAAAA